MKPGSSDRCKSKFGLLRCNRHKGHDGNHQAKQRAGLTVWADETPRKAAHV